jgi:hypothetical protein
MELAELLERESVTEPGQLLHWARQRASEVIAELDADDSLRSLLESDGDIELDLDEVPVARRRRREPSSPQPKSADELPPPPEHPRLADGEPEPMLEHVDTGPIDLEEEIVRRKIREDSWALAAREAQAFVEREPEPEVIEPMSEPSVEIDVDVDVPEPEAPVEPRSPQHSEPELPVVVGPAETVDDPIDAPGLAADVAALAEAQEARDVQAASEDDEFEVDDLDEIEVDDLEEVEEDLDSDEEEEKSSAAKPPRPPPPKPGPPPIRNEVADMIASLAEPKKDDGDEDIDIDVD